MTSSDWWSRKLRSAQPPAQGPLPPTPVRAPQPTPQRYVPAAPVPQSEPTSVSEALATGYVGKKAAQRSPQARCPECDSGNFGGSPGYAPHCFDCGYVLQRNIRNSTQGIAGDGPSTPARQVPSAGYQPGTIIGRG